MPETIKWVCPSCGASWAVDANADEPPYCDHTGDDEPPYVSADDFDGGVFEYGDE